MDAVLESQKSTFTQMAKDLNYLIEEFAKAYKANNVAAQKAEIRRYRVLLKEEDTTREILKDGCEAALQMVKSQQKGRIIEVDDKFGFVVVSLGKNTKVEDVFTTNRGKVVINYVDPQIPQGTILTVARYMPSGEAEYINKVKIVKLDDNCSIAEPIDKQAGKRMREGDMVYLADDEIAKLLKNRK
jgi:predicted RNase H-like nuclease (RuvC/YqgF family)